MKCNLQDYFGENKAHASLGRESLRGGALYVVTRSVNVFVQVGSTILLARLLTPHDYGLVTMVFAIVGFAPMLIDLGTADAAVQKRWITQVEVSALFWLNLGLGSTLAILLATCSPLIAAFYREPSLQAIALASSLTFVFSGVSVQHFALLRRAMQFQRIAMVEISANVLSTAVAIGMALGGCGYWALVAKPILSSAFAAVGVCLSCPWLPGLPRVTKDVKEMIGFGANLTGFTMTDYAARSADRIVLGYCYGANQLGYFQNAFLLYDNLLGLLTQPLHTVAVSGLSKLRETVEELQRSWARALSSLCFFAMPSFALLAVTGQDVVVLLLGQKWAPAGPLLSVFAMRGVAHIAERTLGWLHVAAGRSDRWMRWGFISSLFQLAALFAGLPFGLLGVATAYALATFCLFLPALAYAGRPVGIGARDVIRVVGPQMAAALCSAGIGCWIQHAFFAEYSRIVRIVLSMVSCWGVYLSIVIGLFRVTVPLQVTMSLLREFIPNRRSQSRSIST